MCLGINGFYNRYDAENSEETPIEINLFEDSDDTVLRVEPLDDYKTVSFVENLRYFFRMSFFGKNVFSEFQNDSQIQHIRWQCKEGKTPRRLNNRFARLNFGG